MDRKRKIEGIIFLVLFCLTIPAANWMIGQCRHRSACRTAPCLIPVAPGLMAPSGVVMIGAALVLRDLVQRRLGIVLALPPSSWHGDLGAGRAARAGHRLRHRIPDLRDRRFRRLYAAGEPQLVAAVVASSLVGLVVDFDRLPVARLRLARFPARPDRRQSLDGVAVDSVRRSICAAATSGSVSPRLEGACS